MKLDPAREYRIDYEIVVDCYEQSEEAAGWQTYLDEQLVFPFKAYYQFDSKVAPVLVTVEALEDVDEDALENEEQIEFFVEIIDADGDEMWVPLEQITPLEEDAENLESVLDWHYWKKYRS